MPLDSQLTRLELWTRSELALLFSAALFVVMLVFGSFAFFPGIPIPATSAGDYLVNCKGQIAKTYCSIWWLMVIASWALKVALLTAVAAGFGGLLARRHAREWYESRKDFAWCILPLVRGAPLVFGSMMLLGLGLYFVRPGWWLVP